MIKQRKNTKNKRTKRTPASHVKASLTYIAPHRHTGKRLSHRHTSHGALFILLLISGIILFLSLASLQVFGLTSSGQVNVTLTVRGPAPTVGAVITSPPNNSSVTKSLLEVGGTCPNGTIVAVYDNGIFASSTPCAVGDTFLTTVLLTTGINTLQAQNYDALNQPGPVTDQIHIEFVPPVEPPPVAVNKPEDITPNSTIPNTSASQPSENPCYDPTPPKTTDHPVLTVACIIRNVFVGEKLSLPVIISGGIGPFALSTDWGDTDTPQLYSFQSVGKYTLSHTYQVYGVRGISLHLTDATGRSAALKTVLEIHDDSTAVTGISPMQNAVNTLSRVWVEASVPVYWAAVSLFLGFWVGDLFQRFIGLKKPPSRRRHA